MSDTSPRDCASQLDVVFETATEIEPLLIEAVNRAARATSHWLNRPIEQVSFLFCDDVRMSELNARFRGVPESTDVLTFPADDQGKLSGDLAVCLPYAARQAAQRGDVLLHEVQWLTIHGLLHLAGYDDVEDNERERMQRAMNECAQLAGLEPNPEWTSILPHAHEREEHDPE